MRKKYAMNDSHLLTRKQFEGYNIKEVQLSKQRYAMLSSVINSLNNYKTKKQAMVAFSGDSFYLVINLRDEDFAVLKYCNQNEDPSGLYELGEIINGERKVDKGTKLYNEIVPFSERLNKNRISGNRRSKNDTFDAENRRNEREMDSVSQNDSRQSGQGLYSTDGVQDIAGDSDDIDINRIWNEANYNSPEGVLITYEDILRSIDNNGAFSIAENEEDSDQHTSPNSDENGENKKITSDNDVKYMLKRDRQGNKYWQVETNSDIFDNATTVEDYRKAALTL